MYFKLILESGHVGSGKSLEKVRYFTGRDPVDVFNTAARLPRVKGKEWGTGVKSVQSISREEYIRGVRESTDDPYFETRKKRKASRRRKELLFN